MNKKLKLYNFVLILSGLTEPNESIEDALFEAGCDDALLIFRDNVPYLEFDRQATTLEEAILSAIFDVKSAFIGAKVLRVELEHFANLSVEDKSIPKCYPSQRFEQNAIATI